MSSACVWFRRVRVSGILRILSPLALRVCCRGGCVRTYCEYCCGEDTWKKRERRGIRKAITAERRGSKRAVGRGWQVVPCGNEIMCVCVLCTRERVCLAGFCCYWLVWSQIPLWLASPARSRVKRRCCAHVVAMRFSIGKALSISFSASGSCIRN